MWGGKKWGMSEEIHKVSTSNDKISQRDIMYSLVTTAGSAVNNLSAKEEAWVRSLGQEDPLEKEMATHSGILVWEMPWTEELGWLQFTGLQRVGHDLAPKQRQQHCIF